MTEQYFMCNATTNEDWAYVSLYYYTDNCTLIRYDYADPYHVPLFIYYMYVVTYYITTFFLFPFLCFLFYKYRYARFIANEGDALIARHPDGYWGQQFGDNAPFGQFFANFLRRE